MFYIDWYYIVLVLPMVIFSLIVSASVKLRFKKYSKVFCRRGTRAEDAVRQVLYQNGVSGVSIGRIGGDLTDHFDPGSNTIRLSDTVAGQSSVAAIGVACHEAGHAVQHAEGYAPARLRSAIVGITNIGSKLSMPLIIIGILLSYLGEVFSYIAYAGVALFFLCVIFQLVTLPTEFNASRRAVKALREAAILDEDELKGAKAVLKAAAMTYVAALGVSFMQFLRLLLIVNNSRGRRR